MMPTRRLCPLFPRGEVGRLGFDDGLAGAADDHVRQAALGGERDGKLGTAIDAAATDLVGDLDESAPSSGAARTLRQPHVAAVELGVS